MSIDAVSLLTFCWKKNNNKNATHLRMKNKNVRRMFLQIWLFWNEFMITKMYLFLIIYLLKI